MTDDEDDAFEFTVKIQRGDGTDDRDTLKTKVSADTIGELDEKVEHVREKMADWARGFRDVQPDRAHRVDDDQQSLSSIGGDS